MRWNGKSLQQWLQFEVARSISAIEYGTLQAKGGWGGAIEIIGFVLQKHVNVWVWVPVGGGRYRRTSCFDFPGGDAIGRIDVCRTGGVHYDALDLDESDIVGSFQVRLKQVCGEVEHARVGKLDPSWSWEWACWECIRALGCCGLAVGGSGSLGARWGRGRARECQEGARFDRARFAFCRLLRRRSACVRPPRS